MIGIVLGIIGIIITIAFGIYSVWAYKKSKKTINLEFQNKECYSLFRSDVNRLNIEMTYNKQPLSSNLILLKAKLINNGKIDIDQNRIYSPLKVISNKDFIWLESNITYHPDGASTHIQLNNPIEIQIDWDLLKKDEFIEIEALVEIINSNPLESDKAIDFYNGLSFDFRITDLNCIQKENLVPSRIKRLSRTTRMAKYLGTFTIILGSIFLLLEFVPLLNFMPEKQIIKFIIYDGKNENIGYLESYDPNKVKIIIGETKNKLELSLLDFNRRYKIQRIDALAPDLKSKIASRTIAIVYIIMGVLLILLQWILKKKKAANKPGNPML